MARYHVRPDSWGFAAELLGQLQALVYRREYLKLNGRFKHSRSISQLLHDIGRVTLRLLEPATSLLREFEDISEIIQAAYDEQCHLDEYQAPSLMLKLAFLLKQARAAALKQEEQQVAGETLCHGISKAQMLADALADPGRGRIPAPFKQCSRKEEGPDCAFNVKGQQNENHSTQGDSSHQKLTHRCSEASSLTLTAGHLYGSLMYNIRENNIARVPEESCQPVLKQPPSTKRKLQDPHLGSLFTDKSQIDFLQQYEKSLTDYEMLQSQRSQVKEESYRVQPELSRVSTEAQRLDYRFPDKDLPLKSKVSIHDLLKFGIRPWTPRDIPKDSYQCIRTSGQGTTSTPHHIPKPSMRVLASSMQIFDEHHSIKIPHLAQQDRSHPQVLDRKEGILDVKSTCSHGRPFVPGRDVMLEPTCDSGDFDLPALLSRSSYNSGRGMAPPRSELLSQIVQLLEDRSPDAQDQGPESETYTLMQDHHTNGNYLKKSDRVRNISDVTEIAPCMDNTGVYVKKGNDEDSKQRDASNMRRSRAQLDIPVTGLLSPHGHTSESPSLNKGLGPSVGSTSPEDLSSIRMQSLCYSDLSKQWPSPSPPDLKDHFISSSTVRSDTTSDQMGMRTALAIDSVDQNQGKTKESVSVLDGLRMQSPPLRSPQPQPPQQKHGLAGQIDLPPVLLQMSKPGYSNQSQKKEGHSSPPGNTSLDLATGTANQPMIMTSPLGTSDAFAGPSSLLDTLNITLMKKYPKQGFLTDPWERGYRIVASGRCRLGSRVKSRSKPPLIKLKEVVLRGFARAFALTDKDSTIVQHLVNDSEGGQVT